MKRIKKRFRKKVHRESKRLGGCAICYPWLDKRWKEKRLSKRDQQNQERAKEDQ